jgi:BirA family biotin operon repressor/biotin-[acetyl-CoA-carboxylase] ligase
MKIIYLKEVDSTNEYAKKLIKQNKVENSLIISAETQKKGKGRLRRKWYSPLGGIWFSMIIEKNYPLLSLSVGVGVCKVIQELGCNANIKWPNDILINNKKVAGILCETEENKVVIGVGVNLNIEKLPKEIREKATSILIETGQKFEKEKVLEKLIQNINFYVKLLKEGKQEWVVKEFKKYIIKGRKIRIQTNEKIWEGDFWDVDREGKLVLRLKTGELKKFIAGEVWV